MRQSGRLSTLVLVLAASLFVFGALASATELEHNWYMKRVMQALEKAYAEGKMTHVGKVDEAALLRLTKAPSSQVRGAAIYALGELKNPDSVDTLLACLGDEDPYNRRMAARALSKLADPKAVEPLTKMLGDTDQPMPVRLDIAEVLVAFPRNQQVVQALSKVGEGDHPWLQRRARRTLDRLNVINQGDGKSRFSVSAEGVIADSATGLEWVVGPDKDTSYEEAEAWVKGLKIYLGGWRLPTRAELRGLVVKGSGESNLDPAFKISGWWVWAEPRDNHMSWVYNFGADRETSYPREDSADFRAFAVRSYRR